MFSHFLFSDLGNGLADIMPAAAGRLPVAYGETGIFRARKKK
jgi:hypothetical protein